MTVKLYNIDETRYLFSIGQVIEKLSESKGKTNIERLAYECKISKTYFYKILYGETNTTILVLRRIAKELGVDISTFLIMVNDFYQKSIPPIDN